MVNILKTELTKFEAMLRGETECFGLSPGEYLRKD